MSMPFFYHPFDSIPAQAKLRENSFCPYLLLICRLVVHFRKTCSNFIHNYLGSSIFNLQVVRVLALQNTMGLLSLSSLRLLYWLASYSEKLEHYITIINFTSWLRNFIIDFFLASVLLYIVFLHLSIFQFSLV